MREEVLAAAVRLDEAEALGVVEPLDGTVLIASPFDKNPESPRAEFSD
jgi:hypothetical protein